jgi:hypothetical protein
VDRFRIHSLRDLSMSGAFIASDVPAPIGYEIVVEICGEAEPLVLNARVTRTESVGVGIAFVRKTAEAERRLREVLGRYGERDDGADD